VPLSFSSRIMFGVRQQAIICRNEQTAPPPPSGSWHVARRGQDHVRVNPHPLQALLEPKFPEVDSAGHQRAVSVTAGAIHRQVNIHRTVGGAYRILRQPPRRHVVALPQRAKGFSHSTANHVVLHRVEGVARVADPLAPKRLLSVPVCSMMAALGWRLVLPW